MAGRLLRTRLGAVALLLAGGLALVAAVWLWSGAEGSLATTVRLAQRLLPAGQTLETDEVQGSLRHGGQARRLAWSGGGVSVQAQQVDLAWSWPALLERRLVLSQLHIGHLRIEDRRPATPRVAPTHLRLPIPVQAPFAIDQLDWSGSTDLHLEALSGNYLFDSEQHRIDAGKWQFLTGKFTLEGVVAAEGDLTLDLRLSGQQPATVPGRATPLTVRSDATLRGSLAGAQASLALQAQLRPEAGAGGSTLAAVVRARLLPWQPQPVAQAEALWQDLDLGALWPGLPSTRLTGTATVAPEGSGWTAALSLTNTASGPLDRQRLPLERLQARARHAAGAGWALESLTAAGAGGSARATGTVQGAGPALGVWSANATLADVDPARIDTRLASATLNGSVGAHRDGTAIAFDARLAAQTRRSGALAGLRIDHATLRGRWMGERLVLEQLRLQLPEASVAGALDIRPGPRAVRGHLALEWPGAQARLDGALAPAEGDVDLSLALTDAGRATRWLAALPGWPAALNGTVQAGTGELNGRWRGGWRDRHATGRVEARARLPRLDLRTPGPSAAAWQLRDIEARLDGSLAALSLSLQGEARQGSRQVRWSTSAHGGQQADRHWLGRLEDTTLQLNDTDGLGTWSASVPAGVSISWQPGVSTLAVGAGTAQLRGPGHQTATLAWEPARWSAAAGGHWQSRGQVSGVPLAWLGLGVRTAASWRGDLLLGGSWDAAQGPDGLRLRASLLRQSGDLLLQTDDASADTGAMLRAGIRDARLDLSLDNDRLGATLHWDSERAGEASARFETRLAQDQTGWHWPADAAVSGSLRAALPRVGAWAVLAPPGWRVRGTLDATATLAGTRAQPRWSGSLQADDLALRSAVEGIELRGGRLRATLRGQQLDIDELSLRGASGGGGTGGELTASGSARWLPASAGTPLAQRIQITLDARAQALRLSARADRRLSVSGQVQARLEAATLRLRGQLTADQALFVLPDETAPRLGSDVVVRRESAQPTPSGTPAPAPAPASGTFPLDIQLALDLGPDFQVRGQGLDTRLAGVVSLSGTRLGTPPRLTGEVRTVRGTYRAYGQQLDIDTGVLRFNGPFDNPALDILAIRPHLPQRVGVQIGGTAQAPRVRLYAEPELPEPEKLAWLVLGRGAANGGAESAVLQQAALALLGRKGQGLAGNLAGALGLDELSVRGAGSTDGGAAGATVTVGKRLSRDFYVAYERSLSGALGTLYIFYDLSRRLTLRAQTGEQSAVDLVYTLRYD
jgi:translocation and assembly module TamB